MLLLTGLEDGIIWSVALPLRWQLRQSIET